MNVPTADSFDPYATWLELPEGVQAFDHYALLGLPFGTADLDAIAQAADQQLARVRRARPGPNIAEWSRLLDELNGVKRCLLDPATKAKYDAAPIAGCNCAQSPNGATGQSTQSCRSTADDDGMGRPRVPFPVGYGQAPSLSNAATPVAAPPSPIAPAAVAATAPAIDASAALRTSEPPVARRTRPRPTRNYAMALLALVTVAAAGGIVALLLAKYPPDNGDGASTAGVASRDTDSASAPGGADRAAKALAVVQPSTAAAGEKGGATTNASDGTASPPADATAANDAATPGHTGNSGDVSPSGDAAKRAAFSQAVAAARKALAQRDIPAGREELERASQSAQSSTDREEIRRLDLLSTHLESFWTRVRTGLPKLEGGEEFEIGGTRVAIVEANESRVVIRAAGQNRSYSLGVMPAALVLAVAEKQAEYDANWRLLKGCFLAMDPGGDREAARALWQEAAQGGVETKTLLPELNVPLPEGIQLAEGIAQHGPAVRSDALPRIREPGLELTELKALAAKAQGLTGHREAALKALEVVEHYAAVRDWESACVAAEIALSEARESKNVPLMRKAAGIKDEMDANRKDGEK
ncbi:MAG: hypothetical protein ACOY3P_10650 [Planctomycetota bacterium]